MHECGYARTFAAECDRVFNRPCICTAADCERGQIFARTLGIHVGEFGDELAVGSYEVTGLNGFIEKLKRGIRTQVSHIRNSEDYSRAIAVLDTIIV